jgi:hypothetical protein
MDVTRTYAHVVLFHCPQCGGPLASAFSTASEEVESLDAGKFGAKCRCGWSGDGLSLQAATRSVQPWETIGVTPVSEPRQVAQDSKLTSKDWLSRVAQEIAAFSKKIKAQSACAWTLPSVN